MISIHRSFSLVTGTALLGAALAGCAMPSGAPGETEEGSAAQAISEDICPEGVPAALTPAADQTIKSSLTGVGVQVYVCNATAAGGFTWTFVNPTANLLNDAGRLVGTHFIGPTWQGNDGSAIVGARAAGATVDPTAIPWLLLNVTSHNGVEGRFDGITSVQRLSTVGGLAPASGCDAGHLGAIAQVAYSAQYVFYMAKDSGKVKQCAAN